MKKHIQLMTILALSIAICVFGLPVYAASTDPSNPESYIDLQGEETAVEKNVTYTLRIDVINQVVSAYTSSGRLARQMVCSTGKDETPTPLGTFYTGSQYRWGYFSKFDVWGQYWTRIDGPILFHSVLFTKKDESTLISSSVRNLGSRASHGCVRLRVEDAKWINDNCPKNTKVITFEGLKDSAYTKAVKAKGALDGKNLYLSKATQPSGQTAKTKAKTTVRSQPNNSAEFVTEFPSGSTVYVQSMTNDSWSYIWYQGTWGYVNSSNLTLDPPPDSENPIEITPNIVKYKGFINTTSSPLNLRSEANSSSDIITKIPNRSQIDILEISQEWLYVLFGGYRGYVSSSYVYYFQTKLPAVVNTGGGSLNLRQDATASSSVVAVLPNRTNLSIISYEGDWALVQAGEHQGYVAMQFVELLNLALPQSLTNNSAA